MDSQAAGEGEDQLFPRAQCTLRRCLLPAPFVPELSRLTSRGKIQGPSTAAWYGATAWRRLVSGFDRSTDRHWVAVRSSPPGPFYTINLVADHHSRMTTSKYPSLFFHTTFFPTHLPIRTPFPDRHTHTHLQLTRTCRRE